MTIGGKDTVIKIIDGPMYRAFLRWYCALLWPTCIIDDEDLNGDLWFVYRDAEAQESWRVNGNMPNNEASMFSFIFRDDTLTVTESADTHIADQIRTAYVVFADAMSDIALL